jgi:hypothetical protein
LVKATGPTITIIQGADCTPSTDGSDSSFSGLPLFGMFTLSDPRLAPQAAQFMLDIGLLDQFNIFNIIGGGISGMPPDREIFL